MNHVNNNRRCCVRNFINENMSNTRFISLQRPSHVSKLWLKLSQMWDSETLHGKVTIGSGWETENHIELMNTTGHGSQHTQPRSFAAASPRASRSFSSRGNVHSARTTSGIAQHRFGDCRRQLQIWPWSEGATRALLRAQWAAKHLKQLACCQLGLPSVVKPQPITTPRINHHIPPTTLPPTRRTHAKRMMPDLTRER